MAKKEVDINKKRNSSGSAEIGTLDDGAILEMIPFKGNLLIIKERSIYEMIMADTIDPERKNPRLPSTIQKCLVKQGTESETVSRTFLQAKILLKKGFIKEHIDCEKCLELSLEVLQELDALEQEVFKYLEEEEKVCEDYNTQKDIEHSYSIPSISNVETRCKTIFQKADHFTQALMELIVQFYPNKGLNKQAHFKSFHDLLLKEYGEKDPFVLFVGDILAFMQLIRNIRNCLDHRLPKIKIKDFEIQANGEILTPTIEIDFRESEIERTSLNEILKMVRSNSITIFEEIIGHMCAKNTKSTLGYTPLVKNIPIETRNNKCTSPLNTQTKFTDKNSKLVL